MNIHKIPAAYNSKRLQMQVVRCNDSSKADGSGFNNWHKRSNVNTLKTLNNMITRINNAFGVKGLKAKLAGVFLLLISFLSGFFNPLYGQTQVTQSTAGTYSWTAPAGITRVTVECWGAGGAGGGSNTNKAPGSGGGGGAFYRNNNITVTGGTAYTNSIVVGAGGIGTTGTGPGGASSSVNFGTLFTANGGGGATVNTTSVSNFGAGGAAGTYSGGNGGSAIVNVNGPGGGGGSSAGTALNGNAGTNGTPPNQGTAVTGGGAGGSGGATNVSGLNGASPGGGGGGGGDKTGQTPTTGGNGAPGQVRISYYLLSSTSSANTPAGGTGSVVTLSRTPTTELPVGTYNVTYNISGNNTATAQTATMNVSTAGTGTFTTLSLPNLGSTTVTITLITSGNYATGYNSAGGANNTSTFTVTDPTTLTLGSNAPIAANICAGTVKVPIQSFSLAVTNGNFANLTNIQFTTTGTYIQTDVTKYQLWYRATTNNISGATQLGVDLISSGATATRNISFTSPTLLNNTTYFFWITADIAANPINNHTIAVNAITTSNLTSTNIKAGSPTTTGGTQTLNAINTATTGTTTSICINNALSPTITHTTTGATGIGSATNLPTGVTAGWASNTITISGTPSVNGTYNYTIPLTGGCGTANATGTIIVTGHTGENSAPVAVDDVSNTTTELPVIINVLSNDTDADGQLQAPTVTIAPTNGSVVVNANKTITYTPYPGFSGTDVFTYQVCDDGCPPPQKCATATVTITVVYAYYVCKEGTSTLSVNAVTGATAYQWTLPAGATVPTTPYTGSLPNPVTTTPSIGVNWSGVTSGTNYYICVAPTNDCGPGTSQCVNVVVNQVALVLTPNHILCNGVNNGSISLAVSGGVAPYTYAWTKTGDGSYSANVQNPGGLSPGTYNVTVTSKNGCVASGSTTITQPATAVSVTGSATNATGSNSDGLINITPSGGTGSYTYAWSNGATTQNISGLSAGTYYVTVSDANSCSVVKYFTVNSIGSPLAISSTVVTNVKCNGGSTGAIDIEVIGGTGTYTYAWVATSGGPVPSGQVSSQDLTTLPAGTYQVTVSSTGFTNVVLSGIVVSQPVVLSASSSKTNVTCFGDSNGSVTVTPAGGTTPYSYVWTKDGVSTGATTQNLSNIGPGTYAVTITDANGCTTSTSQTITQPTVISLSGVVTNASCFPVENGTITLTVSGGTPFASPTFYTYLWSNGATTKDISVSSPGTYSVTVTDAAGCKTGKSFEVKSICIEVTKTILTGPTNNNDGTYTLTYQVKVKNSGSTDLTNVQATDNLATTFPSPATFTGVSISSSKFSVNGTYNGTTVTNLLAASQSLLVGEEGFINITVTVTPGATLSYTNNAGGSGVSDGISTTGTASVGVTFTESPLIGVSKQLTAGPTINADGSYNLTFTLKVRNYGDVPLRNVQVADNLITTFGSSATITVLSLSSSDMTVNSSYTGIGTNNLLAGTDVMAVNEVNTIVLALKVTPTDAGPFNNSASASASGPGGTGTTDTSQNGVSPDPDSDGNPANNNLATPVSFPEHPEIGAAKRLVGSPVNNNDGTYSLTYEITVKNTGDVALKNIQVTDNLATTFPGKTVVKESLTSSYFTVNSSYNGVGDINLLTGVNTLAANAQYNILLTVKVTPGSNLGVYNNNATASGASIFNTSVSDVSHNGIDVDPENDGTSNNSIVTPVTFTETPKMGIAKSVGTPINNHDGTYTVAYTIHVKNMGNVTLTNVQVADNLATTFTGATSYVVQSISATSGLTANSVSAFNSTNNLLVSASSSVAYNATATITLSVKVTPGTNLGTYNNSASGTATGPGGTSVNDVSYDGTNPDPDGDGNPTNNALPTPLTLEENPQIEVAKTIFSVTDNSNGTYDITYDIRIDNTGDVPLSNIQVSDDLVKAFSGAPGFSNPSITVNQQPAGSTLAINSGFTGISPNVNLLDGTGTLLYQEYAILRLTVRVNTGIPGTVGSKGGQYTNEVYALANSPGNSYIMNTATVSKTFYQQPNINIIKTLVSNVLNPDGTSTIKFKLEIENMGDVYLNNLKIYDDIVTQFDGLNPTNFVASEGLSLAVNPAWNGTSNSNILAPNQAFDPEITQDYYVYISFIVSPQVDPVVSTASTYGSAPILVNGSEVVVTDNAAATVNFSTNGTDEEICAWRSTKIGIWSDATVWEKLICGSGWLPSTTPPNNDRPIYVIHSVTVSSTVIADSVIIEPTGSVSACAPLTIDNQLVFKVDVSGNAGKLNNCNGCPTNNLTMNPTARAIVRKAYGTGWSMISFPFEVLPANIFKAGTNTQAAWGDLESTTYKDFYMAQYDPTKRSNNLTPSTTSSANFSSVSPKVLVPYKGYITAGKSPAYGSIDFTSIPGTQLDFCSAVSTTIYAAQGTAGPCNEGWNLVGTPYVTSYDLVNASTAPFYVLNTNGTYSTVVAAESKVLEPFSAFFTQIKGVSNSTVNYTITGQQLLVRALKSFDEISLDFSNATYTDNTRIRLKEGALIGFDDSEDAIKFLNSSSAIPQIYSELPGACAVIALNTLPETTKQVDFKVRTGNIGNYTIRLSNKEKIYGLTKVILVDTETGIQTNLLEKDAYTFTNTSTGISSRFYIQFARENASGIYNTGNGITIKNEGNKITLTGLNGPAQVNIYDVVGKLLYQYDDISNENSFVVNIPGVYIMDINNGTQKTRVKVLINKQNR